MDHARTSWGERLIDGTAKMGAMDRVWRVASYAALGLCLLFFASVPRQPETSPFPDGPSYIGLAESLIAGDGYRIDLPDEPAASRYPPGLPLVLAPMSLVVEVPVASVLLAIGFVVSVWAAARLIGGHVAATVAAVLLTLSGPTRDAGGMVLSDLPAATLTVLTLIALVRNRPRLAGILAGFSVWTRLAQLVTVFGLPRRSLKVFVAALILLAGTKVLWGWGYDGGEGQVPSWSLTHLYSSRDTVGVTTARSLPNTLAYPAMLLGLTGGLLLPGALVAASLAVWRRPQRRFFLATILGGLAVYILYYYRDHRFMFSSIALIIIYAGVWCSDLIRSPDGDGADEPAAGQSTSATTVMLRKATGREHLRAAAGPPRDPLPRRLRRPDHLPLRTWAHDGGDPGAPRRGVRHRHQQGHDQPDHRRRGR